jgi:hypothetical protein
MPAMSVEIAGHARKDIRFPTCSGGHGNSENSVGLSTERLVE